MRFATSLSTELNRHPLLWRMVALSASAAFGSALPDLIAIARAVLS